MNNTGNGIYIRSSSNNNIIYHNNFINNFQNAYDECDNIWDDGYPSGGNYWSDYAGVDSNGDGIGDSSYNIPGGSNQDEYPLMNFYNIPPFALFTYSIDDRTATFDASSSYDWDGTILSHKWNFGDETNGTGMIVTHVYSADGIYNVTLTVTDNYGKNDSNSKNIFIGDDTVPPTIIDNTQGFGYTSDSFTFNATIYDNIDADNVYR